MQRPLFLYTVTPKLSETKKQETGQAQLKAKRIAMEDKKKSASSEFDGMSGDKQKALSAALAQIEKQFGKGSIMRLGDAEINRDIQVVSSGSLGLDVALGVGGLARGRVIEIYGPEASGKTTLTLHAIAEMQKLVARAHSLMLNTP